MRVLMVSTVFESVPPRKYGGVELVVYNLVEGLIARGHRVTLFATGDSKTSAKLIPNAPRSLREASTTTIRRAEFFQAAQALGRAGGFDIVHCHFGPDVFPYSQITPLFPIPVIFTLHGRMNLHPILDFYQEEPERRKFNLVSISNDQRGPIPNLNYVATVYNGIDVKKFKFSEKADEYLAFLGRASPEKGIVEAIRIAKRAHMPLEIFAKVDPYDRKYFKAKVKPLIDGRQIRFHGEQARGTVNRVLRRAKATLFPIQWREPFGLVMVESMACGTPVIASNLASTPEIIVDEKTGFLVDPQHVVEESVAALQNIDKIKRIDCRKHVEAHFTADRMVEGYLAAYKKVIKKDV